MKKVNTAKLLEFADWLEKNIKPEQFEFSEVVNTWDENSCGTVCCAVGWLPAFDERVKWRNKSDNVIMIQEITDTSLNVLTGYGEVAAAVFDMDTMDANSLFAPSEQYKIEGWEENDFPECGTYCQPKDVSEAIRNYVTIVEGRK